MTRSYAKWIVFWTALLIVTLGLIAVERGHSIGGIVGTFLMVTGGQILLWLAGVRSEFFGTSSDPDTLTSKMSRWEESDPREREKAHREERLAYLRFRKLELQLEYEIAELEEKLKQIPPSTQRKSAPYTDSVQ